jgi:hypothetical protein
MSAATAPAHQPEHQAWLDFFSGRKNELPLANLEEIAREALRHVQVCRGIAPSSELVAFINSAGSREQLLSIASLRKLGQFPSVYGSENGSIISSRLIQNWNLLLIEEQKRRMIVFQGVSCCDAILIPSEQLLLIVCHIEKPMIVNSVAILCRQPDFFQITSKYRTFGGYLVGHSRPYHCLYDSLIGFEAIRAANQLDDLDQILSRHGESFFRLDECLELKQKHLTLEREEINQHCDANGVFILYLGYWVKDASNNSINRRLAESLDQQLVKAACNQSTIDQHGGLTALKHCRPLIWIGITGQKRSWVEQVDGIASILNQLIQVYPSLGVVFDGWTSPINPDHYHKGEARNDDRVISRICRKLQVTKNNRIGVLAGLPLLDKIRIGLEVDAFISNYTTGSMNVARICKRPGVGHMSQKMMAGPGPHIHFHTLKIDSKWVSDEHDPAKPTGYINYSIPWQVVYNTFIPLLSSLDIPRAQPLKPVELPAQPGNP